MIWDFTQKENVVTYELLRDTKTPTTPPPADSKQLLLRLHMLEKRKNIEKYRSVVTSSSAHVGKTKKH